MKPVAVIIETEEEREARLRRKEETDGLLQRVEGKEPPRFANAMQMFSWFFTLYNHMESVPAIDPSRDLIQGVRVDRDERISWLGKVKGLLYDIARLQGDHRGALLLWLHFRAPEFKGYHPHTKKPQHTEGGVPIWDLHKEPGVNLSQRAAKDAFWRALTMAEDFALERGWLLGRVERKASGERVYQRDRSAEPAPETSGA